MPPLTKMHRYITHNSFAVEHGINSRTSWLHSGRHRERHRRWAPIARRKWCRKWTI